jgi:transcription antitermination factor NusG
MEHRKNKQEKRWYALYTRSRWEKKIHEALVKKGIESYLPMQKTLRQWSDRKKWVEEPLLRSYVFVRIYQKDYPESLKTDGVVTFVKTAGIMSPVQDEEIRILKIIAGSGDEVKVTTDHFKKGDHTGSAPRQTPGNGAYRSNRPEPDDQYPDCSFEENEKVEWLSG